MPGVNFERAKLSPELRARIEKAEAIQYPDPRGGAEMPGSPPRGPILERRPWSAAQPTDVSLPKGVVWVAPSKVEARVARELLARYGIARVRRPRKLNLWSQDPSDFLVPPAFTPDFAVLADSLPVRVEFFVDAKSGKRRSKEWPRGVDAFGASYREPLYEWDGMLPMPWGEEAAP